MFAGAETITELAEVNELGGLAFADDQLGTILDCLVLIGKPPCQGVARVVVEFNDFEQFAFDESEDVHDDEVGGLMGGSWESWRMKAEKCGWRCYNERIIFQWLVAIPGGFMVSVTRLACHLVVVGHIGCVRCRDDRCPLSPIPFICMQQHPRIHALLATARVANLPSVVVNVWLGVVMAWLVGRGQPTVSWSEVVAAMLVGVSLYLAGNFFNDWMDRDWDARWRPERGLPSGWFKPQTYAWLAVVMAGAGIGMAMVITWQSVVVAMAIVGCVIVYTVWHKRCAWAVMVMGLCRAGLVWLGASAVTGFSQLAAHCLVVPLATASFAILAYIAGLSWVARSESKMLEKPGIPALSAVWFLLSMVCMMIPLWIIKSWQWVDLAGVLLYAIWLGCAFRLRDGKHRVSMLLAGIPLVDGMFLMPFAVGMTCGLPTDWLMTVAFAVVPLMAFFAALLLQRLAPAT